MVVNDIEDHSHAEAVGVVDEAAELVGSSVVLVWRVRIHAVVSPAEFTGEAGQRHDFNHGYPQLFEPRQFLFRGGIGARRSEGAEMKLVDHLLADADPLPFRVAPLERPVIDDNRRTVWPFGLEMRGWIGEAVAAIKAKPVTSAGNGVRHQGGEVPCIFYFERKRRVGRLAVWAQQQDVDALSFGSPNAKVRT